MTGWRIGYGVGPSRLISAMSRLQGASTSGACSIAQAAAVEALSGSQAEVERMRLAFAERRDLLVSLVNEIEGVSMVSPAGTFYAFVDLGEYVDRAGDIMKLTQHLLESANLAVVPGNAFGSERHVRLSFACSAQDIKEGISRLRHGLESLGN